MTDPIIDYAALGADDAPPMEPEPDDTVTPDHTRSRPPRSRKFGRVKDEPKEAPATRVRAPRAKPKVTIPKRRGMFVEPLTKMYTAAGLILAVRDPVCGTAILENAEACAKSLDELAYQNDAVRRVLWTLIQTSTWGVVITAHLPILMAIATHHIPAVRDFAGITSVTFAPAPEDESDGGESHAA